MLPITLTCGDYARIMPLATGEVKPEGIALTMVLGSRGSWPARADMISRAVSDPAVQGGEWSMAQYLYRIDKGDHRFVGLPVFPLRNFTARDLYVRQGGPVRRPEDLQGKRIGMYSWSASGSLWYRPRSLRVWSATSSARRHSTVQRAAIRARTISLYSPPFI